VDHGVSVLSIVTENEAWSWEKAQRRFDAVIHACIRLGRPYEVLCQDNSERPLGYVRDYLGRGHHYNHSPTNLLYGQALNRMVARAQYPTVVYFCTNHGSFFDPSWLADLIEPLRDDFVAMAGSIAYSDLHVVGEDVEGYAPQHIQGGLFAAKRDVLRKIPYSSRFPQVYSDLWISWKLQKEGYELEDVPTIKCTGGARVREPQRFKYVHDHFVS
jgi:hypothetical protein